MDLTGGARPSTAQRGERDCRPFHRNLAGQARTFGIPSVRPPGAEMITDFVPLFIMILLALGLALTLLKLQQWLGPYQPGKIKGSPYESGQDPVGSARERYSIKFYLVAMIFIVFDVELVFLYPWAVSFRTFLEAGGGAALASISVIGVFIAILAVGLLYDVKKGGLDWD